MTSYELSTPAYHLLLLHASKYKHSITGILLGKRQGDKLLITQVLPIAHSDLAIYTTPLTETALHLCEHYATTKSLSIVGMYFSNDVVDDTALPVHAVRIGDTIRQRFPEAVICRIDGTKLKPLVRNKQHCLVAYRGDPWKRSTLDNLVTQTTLRSIDHALRVPGVMDFEDHLLDPTADWLNVRVLEELNTALQGLT